nr:hypothetical protein [Anaerotruncus rubiinfantis]
MKALEKQSEIKERIPVWLYPSTIRKIDQTLKMANCRSQSEFLENAAIFYAGYICSHSSTQYLSQVLTDVLRGMLDDSENRMARMLFKLAVETDMMMHVLAAEYGIDETTLRALRGRCVDEVKHSNGSISLDKATQYQKGGN